MIKQTLALVTLLSVSLTSHSAQVIVNGGFETGDFSGWNVGSTQSSPFSASVFSAGYTAIASNDANTANAWAIRNVAANYGGWTSATPISGHSAFNGFDGSPGDLYLSQDFSFTGGASIASLSFDWAVQSQYNGTDLRTFSVNLLGPDNNLLFQHVQPTGSQTSWDIMNTSLDLSTLMSSQSAGDYTLEFIISIPQNYTGPAQFAIDNISMDVSSVPVPAAAWLFGSALIGLAGIKRKK